MELVGRVRADKLEAERMREVAKKKMEEAEVKCSSIDHNLYCTCNIHNTARSNVYNRARAVHCIVAYCA